MEHVRVMLSTIKLLFIVSTGSCSCTQSFYLKDTPDDSGNSDEVRILTEQSGLMIMFTCYVPNLENFDGYGGRKKSDNGDHIYRIRRFRW